MEGRSYSDFYRNTSEELFIKTVMENSIGMPVPTMEMLGLKNLSSNLRTDSEELFKSWLTNGENNAYNSESVAHRTRSRRISNELGSLSNQKMEDLLQRKRSYEALFSQNTSVTDEPSNNLNQHSVRNPIKGGLQGSNLYLAKAWFNSNQPMTRSRSAELRRRYAEMQNSQSALGMEAIQHISGRNVNNLKQEFAVPNELDNTSICEIPNQFNTFMSPNNSLLSTFNTPQMETEDKVSSVVSKLKGTLERKKLSDQIEKEALDDSCLGYYGAQEIFGNNGLNQEQGNYIHEAHGTFQDVSTLQLKDSGVMQMIGGPLHFELEGFLPPTNPIHLSTVSRETSQSESSAAAPILSTGIDGCDGPRSGQIPSICDNPRNQKGRNSESGSRARDIRKRTYDNVNEDRKKKGSLVRYGSVNSAVSVEKVDPAKKLRVERSRKMAEANERNLAPAIPTDTQSILKRCENLEKEVRSLKLNLSFMNRKDSEQTKQIEELQKQKEELIGEKERLLDEIERII